MVRTHRLATNRQPPARKRLRRELLQHIPKLPQPKQRKRPARPGFLLPRPRMMPVIQPPEFLVRLGPGLASLQLLQVAETHLHERVVDAGVCGRVVVKADEGGHTRGVLGPGVGHHEHGGGGGSVVPGGVDDVGEGQVGLGDAAGKRARGGVEGGPPAGFEFDDDFGSAVVGEGADAVEDGGGRARDGSRSMRWRGAMAVVVKTLS